MRKLGAQNPDTEGVSGGKNSRFEAPTEKRRLGDDVVSKSCLKKEYHITFLYLHKPVHGIKAPL